MPHERKSNGGEPAKYPATVSNHRYPVDNTLAWRLFYWDCVDLLIQWDNGSDDTWEPEEIMLYQGMAPLVI